jgi:hypothetical protein
MDNIKNKIQSYKSNLSKSSIDLYASKLKRFIKNKKLPYKTFNNVNEIMEIINKTPNISTRKSILTAIVVYLQTSKKPNKKLIEEYRKPMMDYLIQENKQEFLQQKSQKQKEKWISIEEFISVINTLYEEIKPFIKNKVLDKKQYYKLQSYVILRLFFEYPLRNDIGTLLIVKNEENLDDNKNYFVKGKHYKIILQNYKTSKKYGKREYTINKNLKNIIKILLRHNKCGYLLCNINMTDRMRPNNLTLTLQKIFNDYTGKRVSSSILRHIQATEENKNKPSLQEQLEEEKKIENKYLHNGKMNQLYAKKD